MTFKAAAGFTKAVNILACVLGFLTIHARAWQADNGDGTFKNPVLYADYPDPDVIRVANDFYMVSTTFVDSPGIDVLHSKDLVNWEIVSHVATNLDGGNAYNMIGGTAYRGGFWASSIRFYNGAFYVVANPTFANSRVYYASDAAGPWQYYQLNQAAYDPSLLIETNGAGYIVCGHGPESVLVLSPDFSQVVAVSNNVLNATGEGSHAVKRGNYYYVFTAYPGVWPYELLCSRSTNIFGPYETNHVCLTETTGGHQGGIVDLPDGSDYGFVMKDGGAVGRMTYICPVTWLNGWPVWGSGQVPATATKPIPGQPVLQPATADEFTNSTLGLQWQWNHNPDDTKWSLTARPGYLRLMPTPATNFWVARNTLTQKGQGPWSRGEVKLDLSHLQPGDICGLGTLGLTNGQIAVNCDSGGNRFLSMNVIVPTTNVPGFSVFETKYGRLPVTGTNLYLQVDLDFQAGLGTCSYSFDDTNWATLGGQFNLAYDISVSTFQGEKFAIFCYNPAPGSGYVDVDWFHFSDQIQRGRPRLNAARTTFVADNGQLLRGPFFSTEYGTYPQLSQIQAIKSKGGNALHLYAESFSAGYAPGARTNQVDQVVAMTRSNGLYLVITIGNGSANGSFSNYYVTNFWSLYAPRYANETHVLYEIQNEPFAWGPSYPDATINMETNVYALIRSRAPNTPVLLMTYAVLGSGAAAVSDLQKAAPVVNWSNAAVAVHGYAGAATTSNSIKYIVNAGYPCFLTEFYTTPWGMKSGVYQDTDLTADLERLGASWLDFLQITADFTNDDHFKNRIDLAGISWNPDYGNWPLPRGAYGNAGNPWTTPDFSNSFLSGALQIEAENFDAGGKGVAYYNANLVNLAGRYRTNDTVSIEAASDTGGGYDVTATAAGDWLEYTLNVINPGLYDLRLRVAGIGAGAVQALASGVDLTGPWNLPGTGGNQTWRTVTNSVFLAPGQQKLRLNVLAGGFNLNWIQVSPASVGAVANGTYKLLDAATSLAMQGVTSSNAVIAGGYSGSTYQQWNLQHIGGDQYKVTAVANGWSWNVFGGPVGFVAWWSTSGDQCYIIRPTGGGFFRFIPASAGLCLETTTTNSTALDQQVYSGAANQQWAIVSPSAPAFPTSLNAIATSATQVHLTWNAVAGATSYNVKRSTASGGPYMTVATGLTTTNYTDTVVAGMRYFYVVSAVSGGQESLNGIESPGALPFPFVTQDVGAVGLTGSSVYGNGVFSAAACGSDIWNTADAFRFVYVSATGNCSIVARVTALQNTDPWSKAGVMIRSSLAANAANILIAVTPGNGVAWQYRSSAGAATGNNNSSLGLSAPYWIKLVRSGNTSTGYRSPDGVNWTQQGTATFTMASTAYIGLALCSHNSSSLCAATFDSVTAPGWATSTPPPPPDGLSAGAWDSRVALNWRASVGASSYNVKRATTSGGLYTIIANVSTTNCADIGLINGASYYYVVSALNMAGESSDSTQANSTPFHVPTADIVAASIDGGNLVLSGTNGLAGGAYSIWASISAAGPFSNWTQVSRGYFDTNGNFTATNTINAGEPQRFYLLREP